MNIFVVEKDVLHRQKDAHEHNDELLGGGPLGRLGNCGQLGTLTADASIADIRPPATSVHQHQSE